MKRTVRSLRSLVVLLLTLVALTGWIVSPDRVRIWLEPTTHAAATFTVDSSADGPDTNPGDGVCLAERNACTLRAAIQEANALPGLDTININILCPLPICGLPEIRPASPLPDMTSPVIIVSSSPTLRKSGAVW